MKHIKSYNNLNLEIKILEGRRSLIIKYMDELSSEKEKLDELIKTQTDILNKMNEYLMNLDGIENKLFKEIVINNISISKAVEKVAEEEERDVSTLWKNYYPKIKDKIDELSVLQ